MATADTPIEAFVFEAHRLMTTHPPVWHDPNKLVVHEIACPPGCRHGGQITYTRWRVMPLPERFVPMGTVQRTERREDVYDYEPVRVVEDAMEWHVNFADPDLFVAYGSELFAQDEIQVAEHPVLGALREALTAQGVSASLQPPPPMRYGARRFESSRRR